ncbi:hypothetical protein ATERTT37_004351 [Aspergillus terreus]
MEDIIYHDQHSEDGKSDVNDDGPNEYAGEVAVPVNEINEWCTSADAGPSTDNRHAASISHDDSEPSGDNIPSNLVEANNPLNEVNEWCTSTDAGPSTDNQHVASIPQENAEPSEDDVPGLLVENNRDPTQNILVELSASKTPDWNFFQGPMERYTRFEVSEGVFLPPTSSPVAGDVFVKVSIRFRPVAGRLIFEVCIPNPNFQADKSLVHPDNILHRARLEFDLHPPQDVNLPPCVDQMEIVEHFPLAGNADETGVQHEDPCFVDITFIASRGISRGLLVPDEAFSDTTRELLSFLRSFAGARSNKPRKIKFRVDVEPQHVSRLEGFLQTISQVRDDPPTSVAWNAYRSKSGNVRYIHGQQKPRQIVRQEWGSDLVKFKAEDHFHDLDEYLTKMAYGATIEWSRPYVQTDRVQDIQCSVTVKEYGTSVIAIAELSKTSFREANLPDSLKDTELIIPHGTTVQVIVTVPQKGDKPRKEKTKGITIPNYADFGVGNVYIALFGRKLLSLARDQSWTGQLHFEVNTSPLRRQLNCLHLLDGDELRKEKWMPVILNQEPAELDVVDPVADVDEDSINAAFQYVFNLKPWNTEQQSAIRLARKLPGRFGLIQGYPGCGKTAVMAALALFYVKCGLHVILCGASNSAVDALLKELQALEPTADVLRIRRGAIESRAKLQHNAEERAAEEDELEAHAAIIGLLKDIVDTQKRKIEGEFPDATVFQKVLAKARHAIQNGITLQIDVNTSPSCSPDEEDTEHRAELKDAYQIFHQYLSSPRAPKPKMGDSERDAWYKNEREFKKAYEAISAEVNKCSKIVACTNNLAGTELVRKHFAESSNGIMVLADEDGQAIEIDALIPIMYLDASNKVKGTIRGGDSHQLPPLVLTAQESPGFNEFGPQIATSLFDRLLKNNFPSVTLSRQHRMNPTLAMFPSAFTYKGSMKNDPSVSRLVIPRNFEAALLRWCKEHTGRLVKSLNGNTLALHVDGTTSTNALTCSRSNSANVAVAMDLLESLVKDEANTDLSIAIIVPYADQRVLYVRALLEMAKGLGRDIQRHVSIKTIDSIRGGEADVVILDWVVSGAERNADLGFTRDNRRANVALTRARLFLVTVSHSELCSPEAALNKIQKPVEKEAEILAHCKQFGGDAIKCSWSHCPKYFFEIGSNDAPIDDAPVDDGEVAW